MNNYDELHKSICRICLNYGNSKYMVSLIDNNSADGLSCHGKAVLKFANISIKKGDNYPPAMCLKCLNLLKQAIHFKLLCEASDKCLKNLTTYYENPKERIVDYTLLKYYFPEECSKQNTRKRKPSPRPAPEQKSVQKCIISALIESEHNKINMVDDYLDNESLHSFKDEDDKLLDEMEKLMCPIAVKSSTIQKPYKRKPKLKRKSLSITNYNVTVKKKMNSYKKMRNPMACDICNKVLANQATYEHHMQRHNGCRYICEHCGKGFPIKAELQYHQVCRHSAGAFIQCPRCPFKAGRKLDLIEHERIHTGERPYACEQCGLTFRRRAIWKKHLVHHAEKKIQCPQCPKKFYLRSDMLSHANSIHDRVYMYLCNECGATYAKPATVRRHLTERHGIPRDMQGKVTRINKDAGFKD